MVTVGRVQSKRVNQTGLITVGKWIEAAVFALEGIQFINLVWRLNAQYDFALGATDRTQASSS